MKESSSFIYIQKSSIVDSPGGPLLSQEASDFFHSVFDAEFFRPRLRNFLFKIGGSARQFRAQLFALVSSFFKRFNFIFKMDFKRYLKHQKKWKKLFRHLKISRGVSLILSFSNGNKGVSLSALVVKLLDVFRYLTK